MGPVLLDSITDLLPGHAGRVVVSGSHGGRFPATLASVGGVRAVILVDAGIGLDRAGVAGVEALDRVGMAAAAVDVMSCRIGDASDMMARGRITVANAAARALGVEPGLSAAEAAGRLAEAPSPEAALPALTEARAVGTLPGGAEVLLLDSASLVVPGDEGRLVVTGSHGGLIGADPARALKARAAAVAFNDAGRGAGDAALARLPALDARGVAAVCVSHRTARIGDARSALGTGVVSAANDAARRAGAAAGMGLRDWLDRLGRG